MKNYYSFGNKSRLPMKRILLLAFVAFSFVAAKAQSSVTVAYGLDSLSNPLYGDIFLFDSQEKTPFYVIVDDKKPINCNKLKVKAFYRDSTNGKKDYDYWVYQGEFEFPITPNYTGYWIQLNAFVIGEYRVEVNGYLNGGYVKYFGARNFGVYSEDDFWSWGWW